MDLKTRVQVKIYKKMAEVESVTNVQEEVVEPTEDNLAILYRKIEELNVLTKWIKTQRSAKGLSKSQC